MNLEPSTIFTGDNLPILRRIDSNSIDLIYLDPPFNSNTDYAAPIGSPAEGAEFKDTWTLSDIDEQWVDLLEGSHPRLMGYLRYAPPTDSDKSYLIYMAPRLMEMRRILKAKGSIYLHCDPTMSHYLKGMMDCIFGRKSFQNEVIWSYGLGGSSNKKFSKKHDVILFYTKSHDDTHYFIKPKVPATSQRLKGMMKGATDVIDIPTINNMAKERTGYPTQKPIDLLRLIVEASCPVDGIVLDPFCGCATTCIAAEGLYRRWVGIDISAKSAEWVTRRMREELGLLDPEIIHRRDLPRRTDLDRLPPPKTYAKQLYGMQEGHCVECKHRFPPTGLHVDHIVAESKGGSDHLDNLQLLCAGCNSRKGNRGMAYLKEKLKLDIPLPS